MKVLKFLANTLVITFLIAALGMSLAFMLSGYSPAWGAAALLSAFALVVVAARFWANTPRIPARRIEVHRPPETGARVAVHRPDPAVLPGWLIWDTPLPPELSQTEREMLAVGMDPVDARAEAWATAINEPTRPLGIHRPHGPEHHLVNPPRPGSCRRDG